MTGIADTAPDMLYLGAIVNQNASKLLSGHALPDVGR